MLTAARQPIAVPATTSSQQSSRTEVSQSELRVVVESGAGKAQLQPDSNGKLEAEIWCEFECVAYVFVGDDPEQLHDRIRRTHAGDPCWDYVRNLSRHELYQLD